MKTCSYQIHICDVQSGIKSFTGTQIFDLFNPNKTGLLKLVERLAGGKTPYTPKNHFGVSEPPTNVHGGGYTHTNLISRRTDL